MKKIENKIYKTNKEREKEDFFPEMRNTKVLTILDKR